MPKGYWVVDLEVSDPEAYKAYQAFVRPFLAENEGRFLHRGPYLRTVSCNAYLETLSSQVARQHGGYFGVVVDYEHLRLLCPSDVVRGSGLHEVQLLSRCPNGRPTA